MLKNIRLFIVFSIFINFAFGYEVKQKPTVKIKKAVGKILLDGVLDEEDWLSADVAKDFYNTFPHDTGYADTKTESRITYDDKNIYVSAICYDELEGNYVIQSLKRDFSYPVSDAFSVIFDPFDDNTNGFSFAVNPYNVQREGLVAFGGGEGVSTDWDNVWYSEVKREKGKWVVEMAIPFVSLRYKTNIPHWGVNFTRNDLKRNESSCWSAVPRVYNIASLAFTGDMLWDNSPKKPGTNIALIPYVSGEGNHNYVTDNKTHTKPNGGLDAKIAVSPSLNLDITINPDFSQVEVDRQVTNLTRFSLFFPERRKFFIENSDLFERYGFRQIRPFFSRQIGLNSGNVIPILGGMRLSGKINKNWRIGIMSMQTDKVKSLNVRSQNYTVVALQRQVFARSNVAAIFVNRQAFLSNRQLVNDFNRLAGLDFNLASKNNKFRGKVFYHHAFTPLQLKDNYTHASWFEYFDKSWLVMWNHEYVGKNYLADVGFVPRVSQFDALNNKMVRNSYWRFEPMLAYKFYPKSSIINNHGPGIYLSQYLDSKLATNESLLQGSYKVIFQSSAETKLELNKSYVKLLYASNITSKGLPLAIGDYNYNNALLTYTSNKRKLFNYLLTINYGEFYNGTKFSYSGELNYRKQPWGIFSLAFSQDEIKLPEPYSNAYLTLIGPKVELSFTKSIFFTTFFQYNTQLNNFNINSRLQWRFKPMSDFYIVYTENYITPILGIKNRALVFKFIYLLNL